MPTKAMWQHFNPVSLFGARAETPLAALPRCPPSRPHPAALQATLARVCFPPGALSCAGAEEGETMALTASLPAHAPASAPTTCWLLSFAEMLRVVGPLGAHGAMQVLLCSPSLWVDGGTRAGHVAPVQLSARGCFEGPGAIKKGQEHPRRSHPLCSCSRRAERCGAAS